MSPSGPLQIIALRPIAVGSVAWRLGAVQRVSVVVKATFGLVNDQPARLVAPQEIVVEDRRMQGLSSLEASAENAPYLPSAGVVLTGHAYAPGGTPTSAMSVRLAVYRDQAIIDKTLHVFGDRNAATAATPQPFVKMPLVWEKAFGGTGVEDNPVGLGAVFGIRALPNLVDPGDQRKPACFGPIPRQWVARRRLLGNADPRLLDRATPEMPEDFDWRYFHAAPVDQQVDFLHGDEWIVLDGLHPTLPRLQSRLPQVKAKALWRIHTEIGEIEEQALDLVADLLIIDADRQVCSLVWRGNFFLDAPESLPQMQVYAGVEMPGYPLVWPEMEGANAAVRASFDEPAAASFDEPASFTEAVSFTEAASFDEAAHEAASVEPPEAPAPSIEAPPATRSIPPIEDDEHTRVAGFVLPGKGVLPFQRADGAIGDEGSTLDQPSALRVGDARLTAPAGPAAPAARETDRLIASKVGRAVLPFSAHAPAPSADAPPAPRIPQPAAKPPLGQTGDERLSPFASPLPFKSAPPPAKAARQIPSMVPDDDEDEGDPIFQTSAIRREDHLRFALRPATPFTAPQPEPAAKPAFPGALFGEQPAEPDDGTREYQLPVSSTANSFPADLPFNAARPRDLPFAAPASPATAGLPFAPPQGPPAHVHAPPPLVTRAGQPVDDTLEHPIPAELARRIDLALADPAPPPPSFRPSASPAPPPLLTAPQGVAPPPMVAPPPIVGAPTIDPLPPRPALPAEPPRPPPPLASLSSTITEVSTPIAVSDDDDASIEQPVAAQQLPEPEPEPEPDDGLRAQVRAKLLAGDPLRDLELAGADLRGVDFSAAMLGSVNLKGARLERCIFAGARLADAQLAGADLTQADLRGADLTRADLTRATLTDARLDRAILTDANLSSAKGNGAVFDAATGPRPSFARGVWDKASFRNLEAASADFTGASLSSASFEGASLIELRLDDARAEDATFDGARMPQASARGATLTRSSFKDADSPGSNWEKATLDDSAFQGANLKGASLVRATCQRTSFAGADIAGANLQNLAADGADLSSATLEGADLRQARLREARFDDANLRKVIATKADLGRCRFVRADLGQATLRTAKLKGANFTLAKLEGADLRDADLEQATLSGASKQTAKLNGANLKDVIDGAPDER